MSARLVAAFTAAAGLVLSLGVAAPGASALVPPDAGDAAMSAGMPTSMHHDSTSELTVHQRSQIATARVATKRFRSTTKAGKAGYGLFRDQNGLACIAMRNMGVMGVHLVNGDVVGSPRVALRRPEALVYQGKKGHRHLVALEYLVLRKEWEKVHGKDANRPRLFGQRFDLTRAGNRFGLPAFYSLHAWIWKDNPAGTFAAWDPSGTCCHCSR